MNRTGLAIALAVAAVTGLVFGFRPELDVAIARAFFTPKLGFTLESQTLAQFLRDASMWIVALIAAPAVLSLVGKLVFPNKRMLVSGRATLLLVATLIAGPLLAVNVGLKDYWSRPRPRDVIQFGAAGEFKPWWDPRGACQGNCSFVAGEAAGAAWTLTPAALAPPHWRALAYAGALAFTAAVGALRMAFGGHFFSDVVFAGTIVFLIIWFMHGLIYRWRTGVSDAAIEGTLARVGRRLRRPFAGKAAPPPQPQNAAGPNSESYSSLQKGPP